MIVIDDELLEDFARPGRCELCGKYCIRREGHHYIARGIGGGSRMDVKENLISIGSTRLFQCQCHTLIHNGKIPKSRVLEVIAAREGMTPEEVTDFLNELRWRKK